MLFPCDTGVEGLLILFSLSKKVPSSLLSELVASKKISSRKRNKERGKSNLSP
jgi:hypothetical protein